MKLVAHALGLMVVVMVMSCQQNHDSTVAQDNPLVGTWQLVSGTLIDNGDTSVTDYTRGISMIKILNRTHFAFVNHDLNRGQDSTASFSAGGGRYTLQGNDYTEFLEYCSAREWEGNKFSFTIEVRNDTLIQKGIEKIEELSMERMNIEVYTRVR